MRKNLQSLENRKAQSSIHWKYGVMAAAVLAASWAAAALLLACLWSLVPMPCRAEEYYVSADGNDGYDGLRPSWTSGTNGPFQTIEWAAGRVVPGDGVSIRGGVYTCSVSLVSVAASASLPIRFGSYSNETVRIAVGGADWATGFEVRDCSHIHLGELHFLDNADHKTPVEFVGSTACSVSNCVFSNNAYSVALSIAGCTNLAVDGSLFADTGTTGRSWDAHVRIDGGSSNITVRDCEFIGGPPDYATDRGVELVRASCSRVTGNRLHDAGGHGVCAVGIPDWEYVGGEPLPQGNLVESNTFTRNAGGVLVLHSGYRSTVSHNLFASNTEVAVAVEGSLCFGNVIRDNVFIDNMNLAAEYFSVIDAYEHGWSNEISGNEIYNTYLPEEASSNCMIAIQVMRVNDYMINSNIIHDIVVKHRVDYSDVDPDWVITPEEGGRGGMGIFASGDDREATHITICGNSVSNTGAVGIYVSHMRGARVTGNTVAHCGGRIPDSLTFVTVLVPAGQQESGFSFLWRSREASRDRSVTCSMRRRNFL